MRPGRFQAFDAEVAVTVCAAAASDDAAYGRCTRPSNVSGAWISSANTRASWRSTTPVSPASSSWVSTRPVGLWGLTSTSSFAPDVVNAVSRASRSSDQHPSSCAIGTRTSSRPSIAGTRRNGMYPGVGSRIGLPGGLKCRIVAVSPVSTSGSGRTRSGSSAQPKRSDQKDAHATAMSATQESAR